MTLMHLVLIRKTRSVQTSPTLVAGDLGAHGERRGGVGEVSKRMPGNRFEDCSPASNEFGAC